MASRLNFTGNGNTARNGELSGSIAVRVTREMPNGDLFVEGTKLVRINSEQYHLYRLGPVRRADIAQDNLSPRRASPTRRWSSAARATWPTPTAAAGPAPARRDQPF